MIGKVPNYPAILPGNVHGMNEAVTMPRMLELEKVLVGNDNLLRNGGTVVK